MTERRESCADAAALRLGISRCLLGSEVRYHGGDKRDAFLTDVLSPFVERIFAFRALRGLFARCWTLGDAWAGASYLEAQSDLEPHPKQLMLRNHA